MTDQNDWSKELHRIVTTTLVYRKRSDTSEFEYLITKRAMHKKVMPGKWTIPGGGLSTDDYVNEPSSTPEGNQWYHALDWSLHREIKEEVNLEIGKPELVTNLTFIRPDGIPVLCLSYFAQYLGGEAKVDQDENGDTVDLAWVTLEQAKGYDLIDGIWDEIREVEEILKSRAR